MFTLLLYPTVCLLCLQPFGHHLEVLVCLFRKHHVARAIEEFPFSIRYSVEHGLGDVRCTQVVGTADDECRTGDLTEAVGIVEVLQCSGRIVFVRSPGHEISLIAKALLAAHTLRCVRPDDELMARHVVVIGFEICR